MTETVNDSNQPFIKPKVTLGRAFLDGLDVLFSLFQSDRSASTTEESYSSCLTNQDRAEIQANVAASLRKLEESSLYYKKFGDLEHIPAEQRGAYQDYLALKSDFDQALKQFETEFIPKENRFVPQEKPKAKFKKSPIIMRMTYAKG